MSASGYVKGQITRATNALKEKLTAAEQTMIEFYNVKDSKEDLEKDLKTVTACKRQMLDIVVGLNQWMDNLRSAWQRGENYIKELEDEKARFDVLQEFMDHWEASRAEQLIANAKVLVITAESIKASLENTPNEEKLQNKLYTKHTSEVEIQLPKLEMPEFEGDMVHFPEFWELYSTAVHNHPTLGAASKFLHLKSKLKGRAGDLIASMRLSAENYPRAVELLLSTYNRPDILRNRLVEQLEALPPAGKAVTDQRTTLCKVKAIWVQLANLNEQPGSTTTMRIIRSKFPRKTREKVGEMRRKNDNWTAEDLLDAFDKVIDQLEIMEDTDPTPTATSKLCVVNNPQTNTRHFEKSSRRRPSTQRSPSTRSDGSQRRSSSNEKRVGKKQLRCSFCLQTRHKTAYCDEVVSPYERRKIVIQSKLCWKCLRAGHQRLRCDAPRCRNCGRSHHWSLCLQGTYSHSPSRSNSPIRPNGRQSSMDSFASDVNSRNESGSNSRSPSPYSRGRSPVKRHKQYRKGSPHPKVGFRDLPRTHTYTNPFLTSDKVQTNPKTEDESDRFSDEIDDEVFCVNTTRTEASITNTVHKRKVAKKDLSETLVNPPRLMVTKAHTLNRKTKIKQVVTVLLDSGSQHSYIKEDTARSLGLEMKNPHDITAITFGGHSHTETSYRVQIVLQDKSRGYKTKLHLWTRKIITTVSTHTDVNDESDNSRRHKERTEVDILIGMDYYWDVVDHKCNRQLPSGLVQSNTKLGPILSGNASPASSRTHSVSDTDPTEDHQATTEVERLIHRLFGIESICSTDESDNVNESIIQRFYDTVQTKNGLIYVQFPWKTDHPPLADNKALAVRRLENQYNKLRHHSKLWEEYCKTFEQQLELGIIEDVRKSSTPGKWVYYIPHQAVLKEDSATTKLRIVFDASSHMKGVPSLNDCVHQGPTLIPDLCGTLLRARLTPVLIISDVEKAFHQIRLQEDQRDATRFLWLKDTTKGPTRSNIRVLRFTRIPFGVNASPFLLSMSIKFALERDESNQLRDEILANTYVDNVLISAKTAEEGIRKRIKCKNTFSKMGMNLREFMSNNSDVLESIPPEDRMKTISSTVKLLGLRWNTQMDTISVPIRTMSKEVINKRTALKAFASTFDPLGLLCPLFIRAKIFIQDLWANKFTWDDPFDEATAERWKSIAEDIKGYTGSVPRVITTTEEAKHDLVIFSDASQRVYAAVAYLVCRSTTSRSFSNLVFAKAKLATMKKISIPRLELLGCVLATKLVRFLRKQLKISLSSVQILSDSQIALYWIHSDKQLKTFVNNRVKSIKDAMNELTEARIPYQFHYVNTEDNPADCATRGLPAPQLTNHMWWEGPSFILNPPTSWPYTDMDFKTKTAIPKEAQQGFKSVTTTTSELYNSFIPFSRTNSYTKLLRITSYVLKYIGILWLKSNRGVRSDGTDKRIINLVSPTRVLTTNDMRAAEILLLREHYREGALQLHTRVVQRIQTTMDDDGIYRGSLRMANAEIAETAKTPILLLPKHQLTKLIISHRHQKLFHAGASHLISDLRNHYLIPRIRRIVNSIIKKCVLCKRHQGRPFSYPPIPDLPSQRVIRSRPFQNTGLDYFGPLVVHSEFNQDKKVWVCLFTCMATRALHLEIVADNSAPQFLLAFRRFVARRGAPNLVLSDNAPTFKLGREILVNELKAVKEHPVVQQFTSSQNLHWKFITPLSPWKGGFYERLVGSVKTALKKTIHRQTIDLWTLQTLISEIESTLNTRPITPVLTNESENGFVLRPIDLINPYFTPPNTDRSNTNNLINTLDSHEELTTSYTALQETLERFWKYWQKDYLQSLAERNQARTPFKQGAKDSPKKGDVVLIKQESISRSHWPLGIIVQINKSVDGLIRSVKIKTGNNKILDRSINQLIPLEVCAADEENVIQSKKKANPTRIQPERKAKNRIN